MSSYFLGMSTMASLSCSGLSGDESWLKVLWRMSLPPRVKIFLRKASRNWLPTRGNLFAHKVRSNLVAYDIQLLEQIDDDSSLIDLVLWFKRHAPVDSLYILCVVWWRLWQIRNNFVFSATPHQAFHVVKWAAAYLYDFHASNKLVFSSSLVAPLCLTPVAWRPPLVGVLKINSDAGISEDLH
ncbi:hypothetical protein ACOSP7_014385 [Xanthoceras sorbifolium]